MAMLVITRGYHIPLKQLFAGFTILRHTRFEFAKKAREARRGIIFPKWASKRNQVPEVPEHNWVSLKMV
jgi:hypothetical protein